MALLTMNFWNIMYLFRPPWDTGKPLPEFVELVESGRLASGRAIDLGCGTGTNVIYLAQHGFDAVGVDIAPRAIAKAQRKAEAAGVHPRFLVADVTDLPPDLGLFDLALDVGCFHSLKEEGQRAYVRSLARVLRPEGVYLLWTFRRDPARPPARFGPRGVTPEEVRSAFEPLFAIEEVKTGEGWRPTALYVMKRSESFPFEEHETKVPPPPY